MALSYTGKLFRRIAICCGAAHGNPHKVWENHLQIKYMDEYFSYTAFLYHRGNDNKWTAEKTPEDNKEFEFWKGLKWLEENGYIARREGTQKYGTYGTLTCRATYIVLTEKGLAVAPKYLKQKED